MIDMGLDPASRIRILVNRQTVQEETV